MKKQQSRDRRARKLHQARKLWREILEIEGTLRRTEHRISEDEQRLRKLRTEFKEAGRLDLAKNFLKAPHALREVASYLWGESPMTTSGFFGEGNPAANCEVLSPDECRMEFELQHSGGKEFRRCAENFIERFPQQFAEMVAAKIASDFLQRARAAMRKGQPLMEDAEMSRGVSEDEIRSLSKKLVRETLVRCGGVLPLEEWACIFPEAFLAGDLEFSQEVTAAHPNVAPPFDRIDLAIMMSWHGFRWGDKELPPLKYWSDKAAWECVKFLSGEALSLPGYKHRKNRLGRRNEKPTRITTAVYYSEGGVHRLTARST